MSGPQRRSWPLLVSCLALLGACTSTQGAASPPTTLATATIATVPRASTSAPGTSTSHATSTTAVEHNVVYADAGAGALSAAVADAKAYVYVPSNDNGSVTVIDQATMQIVRRFPAGKLVQHVVPSWDLKTLYALASGSSRLVAIDPSTGTPTRRISVAAPYNLYFTPDGASAVVMAERRDRIDYYDPATWKLQHSTPTGSCQGVNHADWSPDGSWFLATCEFSGEILKVDSASGAIIGELTLAEGAMPQDLRLAPDGSKFYVADMAHGGVWVLNGDGTTVTGFVATGVGAHGIYPSRDGTLLYVTNRGRTSPKDTRRSRPGEGSVSVVNPATDAVVATWPIPDGGSPDMGGVSADGKTLWLSGRYDAVVYVFDTATGSLKASIPVPPGPHGLCVYPQPGRYSLGHTGNTR